MSIRLIDPPRFATHGVEIVSREYLLEPAFRAMQQEVYRALTPARNATNRLARGLRWGVLIDGAVRWTEDDEYALSAELNPEEGGRVRQMDLLPDRFVTSATIEQLVLDTFAIYHPDADSARTPFIVQMSAIRYQPSVERTCYPSPDAPHQDGFDNGIFVLARTANLAGGATRLFTLEGRPMYETMLAEGQGIHVADERWLHQVLPMTVDTSLGDPACCYRDILIVRIDPASR